MSTETAVYIDAIVRDAVDSASDPDPHVIARDVLATIADADVRNVLRQVLIDRVRIVVSEYRRAVIRQTVSASHSPRWDAAGDDYARIFRTPIHCGDRGDKFLGECDREDVLARAAIYRTKQAEMGVWAERFESLARLMRSSRVRVVSDLPAEKVAETLDA
jgi:hypothetical protein